MRAEGQVVMRRHRAENIPGLDELALDAADPVQRLEGRAQFVPPDAEAWSARLDALNIVTDRRGTRLRFGFGLYHTAGEVDGVLERLSRGK